MSDAINPAHYKRLPAEAIEIIEAGINKAPSNQDAYLHGQVLKYILRCWNKNGIEDLRKAQWYLDRLINRLYKREQQKAEDLQSLKDHPSGEPDQPAWTPNIGDWVRIKKPINTHSNATIWFSEMDKYDGQVVQVKEVNGDGNEVIQDGWGFLFDWLEQAEPTLNSDKIPEGYRKLNDSSIEPRQLGDLRWSVSEKRYVEIGVDEIGYANRNNWAACRKAWRSNDSVSLAMQMAAHLFGRRDGVFNGAGFSDAMRQIAGVTCNFDGHVVATILDGRSDVEVLKGGSHYRYLFYEPIDSLLEPAEQPVVKQSLTTEPPDGWRFLEVGELIRKGDRYFKDHEWIGYDLWVGGKICETDRPSIRRNRFEVGEKVVSVLDERNFVVIDKHKKFNDVYILRNETAGTIHNILDRLLAPYIEDAK